MNHLAHLYLSQHSEKMMVGNFIADGVKGKKYLDFEGEISKGIVMHRAIDTFTDTHDIVRHSKSFFREKYGLYSPVLIDLFYDHFLAKNWNHYSDAPLIFFTEFAYRVFEKYIDRMPERYQHMFPYMQKENWLLNYGHLEGIQRSLTGMSRRIKNNPGIENATWDLRNNYDALEDDFRQYFPELTRHIAEKFPAAELPQS
ncbi:MAG: ACP phosphodiesterase [Chitinophagales bacterium]|nr:ACP phosphodiesterase [Chitinophagales bacterium]